MFNKDLLVIPQCKFPLNDGSDSCGINLFFLSPICKFTIKIISFFYERIIECQPTIWQSNQDQTFREQLFWSLLTKMTACDIQKKTFCVFVSF